MRPPSDHLTAASHDFRGAPSPFGRRWRADAQRRHRRVRASVPLRLVLPAVVRASRSTVVGASIAQAPVRAPVRLQRAPRPSVRVARRSVAQRSAVALRLPA